MARLKMEELRQLMLEDLKKRLSDEEEGLANLQFQLATRQLESPIKVRIVKRTIAKIKTLIRERELLAAPVSAKPETSEVKA